MYQIYQPLFYQICSTFSLPRRDKYIYVFVIICPYTMQIKFIQHNTFLFIWHFHNSCSWNKHEGKEHEDGEAMLTANLTWKEREVNEISSDFVQ